MNNASMKQNNILSLIFKMSFPIVISMIINGLYNLVDSFFVAMVSEKAMTAVSLIYPLQYLPNAFGIGFGVATASLAGFYFGSGNLEKANHCATKGLIVAIIHGVILAIFSLLFAKTFLSLFTSNEEIIKDGLDYFYIVCIFAPCITVSMALEKILQCQGKMITAMIAMAVGAVTNMILDPVFILVLNMGVKGAALATGISLVISLLGYILIFVKCKLQIKISFKAKGEKDILKKLYSVGFSSSLNLALPSFMIIALNAILSKYDSSFVLILGVYYKLQSFLFFIVSGIVQGIRPLISYNEGSKEYKRVDKIVIYSLIISLVVMVIGTALFLLIPTHLISLFSKNELTIKNGAIALRIICIGFIISAFPYLISGVFEALSKGWPSLIISLIRYLFIIIPALILSHFYNEIGVWMSFPITETVALIVSVILYIYVFKRRNKIEQKTV